MSDRRGRRRSDYDNRDYYDDRAYYDDGGHYDHRDSSYDDYEPRPHHRPRPQPTRQRSLGRQALDKLQSAIGGLVSDNKPSNTHRARSRSRSHSRSRSTSRSRSSSRTRHHSRSPPRRRSTHHGHSDQDRDRDHDRDRDRSRDRYYPPSASRRGRHHSPAPPRGRRRNSTSGASSSHHAAPGSSERSRSRWERGIKAAMEAGAAEAFRLRKEPGAWTGAKGGRIATAALSAGVIRGVAADHHSGRDDGHSSGGSGKLGSLASAAGGMMVNRLVNGPRREVRR